MHQLYKKEEWLKNLYCTKKKTITEIAKIANSSPAQIYRYTKRFNLPRPKEFIGRCNLQRMTQTHRAKRTLLIRGRRYTPASFNYRKKEWLIKQYRNKKLSLDDIASICKVNRACIIKWMNHYQIPRRDFWIRSVSHPHKHLTTHSGYKLIMNPDHPQATGNGYIREHRLVMEKHLGRYLTANEHVHHRDGNKLNNHINNLQLFTNTEHKKFEQKLQLFIKKLMYSNESQFLVPYRDNLIKRFQAFLSMYE